MQQNELAILVDAILKKVAHGDGYVIVRAESRRERSLRLSNGRLERVATGGDEGLGVQVFTAQGVSGFAAADVLSLETGLRLVERALSLARRNERLGAKKNREIWKARFLRAEAKSPARSFGEVPLAELQTRCVALHEGVRKAFPEAVWQSSFRQVEDSWCIGRSDGTRVSFTIPRAVLMHQGTVHQEGKSASTLVHRSGTDAQILGEEQADHRLEREAAERAELARAVSTAPFLASGHYPLVIDYGLAKGLAHEAFGHAVESDHMQESVLGEQGKLKRGLKVARPSVHILDGPLPGDWAYQPFSANGLLRETVRIVQNGILKAGLGDIFSAAEAGMAVSGAGRAESYAHVPLPRMTNIRLIVDETAEFQESGTLMGDVRRMREALLERGEIKAGEKTLLLLGYRGGQVNPKTGDFVFQCEGIVDLGDEDLRIYRPSIFSGKILSALQAIKLGVGAEAFDAIGTCGKGGQSVPSSGGSSRFIFLEVSDQVSLGGEG